MDRIYCNLHSLFRVTKFDVLLINSANSLAQSGWKFVQLIKKLNLSSGSGSWHNMHVLKFGSLIFPLKASIFNCFDKPRICVIALHLAAFSMLRRYFGEKNLHLKLLYVLNLFPPYPALLISISFFKELFFSVFFLKFNFRFLPIILIGLFFLVNLKRLVPP